MAIMASTVNQHKKEDVMTAVVLNEPTISPYNQLLIYRIFFEFNKINLFFTHPDRWDDDNLAESLGIPLAYEQDKKIKAELKQALKNRYRALLSCEQPDWGEFALAEQNLQAISSRLQLNETESALLRLAFYIHNEVIVQNALRYLGRDIPRNQFIKILAQLIHQPVDAVRLVLQSKSKLYGYDLIGLETHHRYRDFDDHLKWGDTLSIDEVSLLPFDEATLLKKCLATTQPSQLDKNNFEHIAAMRFRILVYLRQAYEQKRKGVNILIYGEPGTGKTEFASWLAQELNVEAFTLRYANEDDDSDMHSNKKRLQNCVLAQELIKQKQALIIFDEIEDVFAGSLLDRSVAQQHKAWVNHFLENNPVPMIWLSNDVRCMDKAFLRRYDIVLKMPNLPLKQKKALIRQISDGLLNEQQVTSIAKQSDVPAALLARSFDVAKNISHDAAQLAEHAVDLLNQTLTAQGKRKIKLPQSRMSAFSLDWVACQNDIHKISQGLIQRQRARVCCYGPAGTGKTAWANWLGEQMGLPVLLKQGSDLLGSYVGETEKNIARAFEEAAEQKMVLALDEVDTFLFARDSAVNSWERSMVNEMLTQMERFEGLLIVLPI